MTKTVRVRVQFRELAKRLPDGSLINDPSWKSYDLEGELIEEEKFDTEIEELCQSAKIAKEVAPKTLLQAYVLGLTGRVVVNLEEKPPTKQSKRFRVKLVSRAGDSIDCEYDLVRSGDIVELEPIEE